MLLYWLCKALSVFSNYLACLTFSKLKVLLFQKIPEKLKAVTRNKFDTCCKH